MDIVQFTQAAKHARLKALIGAEVTFEDGCHLTLLAESQAGYANLCRLITTSRLDHLAADSEEWRGKIDPALKWERLAEHTNGLIALTGCQRGPVAKPILYGDEEAAWQALRYLYDLFGPEHLYVELQHYVLPQGDWLNRQLCDFGAAGGGNAECALCETGGESPARCADCHPPSPDAR